MASAEVGGESVASGSGGMRERDKWDGNGIQRSFQNLRFPNFLKYTRFDFGRRWALSFCLDSTLTLICATYVNLVYMDRLFFLSFGNPNLSYLRGLEKEDEC